MVLFHSIYTIYLFIKIRTQATLCNFETTREEIIYAIQYSLDIKIE